MKKQERDLDLKIEEQVYEILFCWYFWEFFGVFDFQEYWYVVEEFQNFFEGYFVFFRKEVEVIDFVCQGIFWFDLWEEFFKVVVYYEDYCFVCFEFDVVEEFFFVVLGV